MRPIALAVLVFLTSTFGSPTASAATDSVALDSAPEGLSCFDPNVIHCIELAADLAILVVCIVITILGGVCPTPSAMV